MNKSKPKPTPTEQQFAALNGAYKYFNRVLFQNKLAGCILNFSRLKNTHGFLAPQRWKHRNAQDYSIHEISLTPSTLYRTPQEIFSTLVHEMVHLWQWDFANPSRNGYHNKEWATKMIEVGLIPSDTGKTGGKQTGQKMTHLIDPEGAYLKAFQKMPERYILPFTALDGIALSKRRQKDDKQKRQRLRPVSRQKTKYTCHSCKINVWGKPKLSLICNPCGIPLEPV